MSNKELFENGLLNLPISRERKDILEFIKSLFSDYENLMKSFNGDLANLIKEKQDLINFECKQIIETITHYQNGFPFKAYNSLRKCLRRLKNEDSLPIQEISQSDGLDEFYRVRTSQSQLRRDGLFHIPYQLREKVATQRYSIPGFPCLYLGDSVYVCWEELGRPEINDMNVCRFNLNSSEFRFLFLNDSTENYRVKCFSANKSGRKEFLPALVNYLVLFPLLACCSMKVQNRLDVYKPEYIIPQLVLQWIVDEEDLDGIKYKSNQISENKGMQGTFMNLVIPVKKVSAKGYCPELATKIKFTEPISWRLLDISNQESQTTPLSLAETSSSVSRVRKLELIKGETVDYSTTKFGILESKLQQMQVS